MKYTSSQAAKILRKLEDDLKSLQDLESHSCGFVAAVGENIEDVRPAYDFADTQAKIKELENKIRLVRHAVNLFNTTQKVDGFDMTIDQVLVYMPQLSHRCTKLRYMKGVLPKCREEGRRNSNIIEYRYANYDIAEVEEEYNKTSDLLARLQIALDTVNNTVEFDIDI